MALTEETKIDKLEILEDGQINVREARVIYDAGKEVARTFHRYVLDPAKDAEKGPHTNSRVQAVIDAVWTDEVKSERKAKVDNARRSPR